jgi:hypothetical protein
VEKYTKLLDIIVVLAILALLMKFIWSRFKKQPAAAEPN